MWPFSQTSNTVWYLQAGEIEGGQFVCREQASAVMVLVKRWERPAGGGEERVRHLNLLLTVQHVLRKSPDSESYWPEYRAWPSGKPFADAMAQELRVYRPLTPQEGDPFVPINDYAFLEFESDRVAFPEATPAGEGRVGVGSGWINIIGFDAGVEVIEFDSGMVRPLLHRHWEFRSLREEDQMGILEGGKSGGAPGGSGGGVFRWGQLIGHYLGVFPTGGSDLQLFMPLDWIRERCGEADPRHELSGPRLWANTLSAWLTGAGLTVGLLACVSFLSDLAIHASPLWFWLLVAGGISAAAAVFLMMRRWKAAAAWVLAVAIPLLAFGLAICLRASWSDKVVVELRDGGATGVPPVLVAAPLNDGIGEWLPPNGPLRVAKGKLILLLERRDYERLAMFDIDPGGGSRVVVKSTQLHLLPRLANLNLSPTYHEHQ